MDRKYAFDKEDEGFDKLTQFNEAVLHINEFGKCPKNYRTDASGYTNTMERVNIEIKDRDLNLTEEYKLSGECKSGTYMVDDCFIESHKAADMLFDYICDGIIPLYINFTANDYVIVHNLTKLKHRPDTVVKKIYSNLYGGFELGKRQSLMLSDAWIWKRTNNEYQLMKRPDGK